MQSECLGDKLTIRGIPCRHLAISRHFKGQISDGDIF